MATKRAIKKGALKKELSAGRNRTEDHGDPKFPYTTEPQALGRLLSEIPKRPKPTKVSLETLQSWGVSNNSNARTAINVLKKLGLLSASNEPTESYVEFMKTGTGPTILGQKVKESYRALFENSHSPQNESSDELKKLFNIHSGGGADAMRLQIQTFKTLADHARFDSDAASAQATVANLTSQQATGSNGALRMPPIQVDLHIHLPENKSSRDYEAIIQDIARYIYGRDIEPS